ncbi:MAG: peptidoglycan-binding domain-containing protein [Patescibacteria group bacterium]
MKKIFSLGISCLMIMGFLALVPAAQAATPTLVLTSGDGDNVQVDVTGDPNSSILLSYQKSDGVPRLQFLGSTSSNGSFSQSVSTTNYGIAANSSVYVTVNNKQSASVAWPYSATTAAGAISLNQTGLVLNVGQSSTLTVSNLGSSLLYLLNNSNPQIANINISGSQITVLANTYGQTVMTVCTLGTTSNCASAYITVQNSGATALTFTQTSLTIAYGQSSTVSVLNGNTTSGSYTILSNSNPSTISSSIDGSTITLRANSSSGKAAITVCSVNMSSCGIINASAGTTSSSSLVFSQTTPTLLIGQSLNIPISGGTSYSVSSNSNSNVVSATITNTNNLTLAGNNTGSSVVTVCASNGNCGSVTATVSFATGGPIALSQSNLWLQAGQAVSVTISGGTLPYSLVNDASNASLFQTNLNNNILTLTGLSAGSGTLSVCSAAGACIQLSVLVNGVSSNTQLTFSNNNLSLNVGGTTEVSLFGSGGFYISSSNNQNIASFVLTNDKVKVTALAAGSANATICQSSGQCSVMYAVVAGSVTTATPPTFSLSNPTLAVGQSSAVIVSGGSSSNYYISSNSNPTVAQASLNGNGLALIGKNIGSTVVIVCAAANNCSSLPVNVNVQAGNTSNTNTNTGSNTSSNNSGTSSNTSSNSGSTANTPKPKYTFTRYLTIGSKGADVTALQTRLTWEKVYTGPITGYYGAQTTAGVKAYQKKYKIDQLGVVGPATRASLNK